MLKSHYMTLGKTHQKTGKMIENAAKEAEKETREKAKK